jgi:NodT family efflux transporter outer membrane factor (OMF) lipoprotein
MNAMSHKSLSAALALIMALGGIMGGCVSVYQRPITNMPDQYAYGDSSVSYEEIDKQWWRSFGDTQLDSLVDLALAHNLDLAVSSLSLRRAQLLAGITSLDQWPQVSGSLTAGRADELTSFGANLNVSYDLDLTRRLSSSALAARLEARAAEEDGEALRIALIGTVCQIYWDIAFTHEQIRAGELTLGYQRKLLDIVRYQHSVGAISGLEVALSQQALSAQLANQALLAQDLVVSRSALALLLGNQPMNEAMEPKSLPDISMSIIPAGLPADLLARRPDLRSAEMRLRAILAQGDAVRAGLYPDLSLTASGGAASAQLSSLFDNPKGSLAALITLPFLNWPKQRLNQKVTETDYEIAVQRFRLTLYEALGDVDEALSNRAQLINQSLALRTSLEAAKTAERLYGVRYRLGSVELRLWLDSQQGLRAAQLAYDANRLSQLSNRVVLIQALGGGAD